jgi:hypothetical protein
MMLVTPRSSGRTIRPATTVANHMKLTWRENAGRNDWIALQQDSQSDSGEGMLYTKNAGDLKVYWQGPTVGWDFGGEGARTMMLVYSLPSTAAIYQRFAGISGSAYFFGGLGMTALTANDIILVPIRSGIGLRLGANVGYLKFTPQATWNPF